MHLNSGEVAQTVQYDMVRDADGASFLDHRELCQRLGLALVV